MDALSSNNEVEMSSAQHGYLDPVFHIFMAYQHPIVLVEESAMRWMGQRVSPAEDLDLLVRDEQLPAILDALLSTGLFEPAVQDLSCRLGDPSVLDVPRLRFLNEEVLYSFLSLWAESVYCVTVDGEKIEVANTYAQNSVVIEEQFDPVALDVLSMSPKARLA